MTTAELAERAGTTKRTIRYYLAEGLLPPAGGTSTRLEFSREHELRLRLIQHLQAAGIKLGAVRGILSRYTLQEIEGLVEAFDRGEHPSVGEAREGSPPVAEILQEAPLSLVYGAAREEVSAPTAAPGHGEAASGDKPALHEGSPAPTAAPLQERARTPHGASNTGSTPGSLETGALWRRIRLAEEVEMLVRAPLDPRRNAAVQEVVAYGLTRLATREPAKDPPESMDSGPSDSLPGSGASAGQPTTPAADEEAS